MVIASNIVGVWLAGSMTTDRMGGLMETFDVGEAGVMLGASVCADLLLLLRNIRVSVDRPIKLPDLLGDLSILRWPSLESSLDFLSDRKESIPPGCEKVLNAMR